MDKKAAARRSIARKGEIAKYEYGAARSFVSPIVDRLPAKAIKIEAK
jgi:hypothetical protein